ncbi:MAG: twin-arginine translocase TatA/TatE family subunit [Bacteroidetes bacterium HGW-Bacteroidetes-17]|nr:MAG: twin-arginine translocase TatA/TatE family subunit [Bacteroidetes bacterium HGW-Bacteroidetes-17]
MNLMMVLLGLMGGPELIIVALAIAVLFGGKRIPELMKSIGSGVKELKKVTDKNDITKDIKEISSGFNNLKTGIKDMTSPTSFLKRDKK